ncbi:hypothetical protein [Jiella pelagia]|uniref:Uncharacterized protein n=1 Tax=Jiella pelagia TaxID=2986949 RepID=A0ABY7BVH8_9HYPH|nr:hypothetical protein [Jiella pelagia]WAP67421.1 hypothetical protein OH818_18035 [Jiella pelagia]
MPMPRLLEDRACDRLFERPRILDQAVDHHVELQLAQIRRHDGDFGVRPRRVESSLSAGELVKPRCQFPVGAERRLCRLFDRRDDPAGRQRLIQRQREAMRGIMARLRLDPDDAGQEHRVRQHHRAARAGSAEGVAGKFGDRRREQAVVDDLAMDAAEARCGRRP